MTLFKRDTSQHRQKNDSFRCESLWHGAIACGILRRFPLCASDVHAFAHIARPPAEGCRQRNAAVAVLGGRRRRRTNAAARRGRTGLRRADADAEVAAPAESVWRTAEGGQAPSGHGFDRHDSAGRARANCPPFRGRGHHPERRAGGARRRVRSARPIAAPPRRLFRHRRHAAPEPHLFPTVSSRPSRRGLMPFPWSCAVCAVR
jgi:hypothetical protein